MRRCVVCMIKSRTSKVKVTYRMTLSRPYLSKIDQLVVQTITGMSTGSTCLHQASIQFHIHSILKENVPVLPEPAFILRVNVPVLPVPLKVNVPVLPEPAFILQRSIQNGHYGRSQSLLSISSMETKSIFLSAHPKYRF